MMVVMVMMVPVMLVRRVRKTHIGEEEHDHRDSKNLAHDLRPASIVCARLAYAKPGVVRIASRDVLGLAG